MRNRQDEKKLVDRIKSSLETGKVSEATLTTDDRVLARITDGIYRQPSSAIRELIANAYDADASNVYIQSDFPRFSRISVRDNGNGLTIESLASLIHHIGGSPKRTKAGAKLGVVDANDPTLSPGGRRLIGKIGIGLFSVSQLTRHFQIITKTKGSTHRLVAEVVLKTYTEDDLANLADQKDVEFETGTVRVQSFPAEKKGSHGTEIILLDLKQQTKDLLQSRETWLRVDAGNDPSRLGEAIIPPKYHIGRLEPGADDIQSVNENLPWSNDDPPEQRFAKLYQAIVNEVGIGESTPKLEKLFDNYLRMLWVLSLSAPVDYIEKHPFDLSTESDPCFYLLANTPKGQATKLTLKKGETLRSKLNLRAPERGAKSPFRVFVDEVELKRPIRFSGLPQTNQVIKNPMLFIGKTSPDLSSIPREIRGGDLSFEAYFLWTPKVVPKENTGLLIRISDASGTLFDESFVKYQVSEQTRLRQITSEIFVLKGLDPALNIDRESFNYAHPHYQYLMKWVHNSLRQVANTQKASAAAVRAKERGVHTRRQASVIARAVVAELKRAGITPDEELPDVLFARGDATQIVEHRTNGGLAFDSDIVFAPLPKPKRTTATKQAEKELLEEKMKGLAQILEAYGVFENMSYSKQQDLLRAIVAVFFSGE